jgi:Mat/Ecp fimbriae major subunit
MFNKIKFAVAGSVIAAALASTSAYAAPAEADAEAVVNVLGPVTITVDNALDFGTVAPGASGGSVVVEATAAGATTCTGVVCLANSSAAGKFHISDAIDGATVEVSVGSATALAHDTDTTAPDMALTDLTISATSITYDSAATTPDHIYVGGTLTVGDDQPAGAYTGSFTITAEYP